MKEILERHHLHSKNLDKLEQPSLELQVGPLHIILIKEWKHKNVMLLYQKADRLSPLKSSLSNRSMQLRIYIFIS